MKQQFEADDGTVFDTEQECLDYEALPRLWYYKDHGSYHSMMPEWISTTLYLTKQECIDDNPTEGNWYGSGPKALVISPSNRAKSAVFEEAAKETTRPAIEEEKKSTWAKIVATLTR